MYVDPIFGGCTAYREAVKLAPAIALENVAPALRGKMRRNSLLLFFIVITFLSAYSHAQAWSGVLTPPRGIDWSNAGAVIDPTGPRTQCGSTIAAYSGTAATINSAIAACGSNQYVLLGPGTFTLSTGIDFASKSNVTLRGSGANSTFVVFTISGSSNCAGAGGANICLLATNVGAGGDQSYNNQASWTGGYSRGSTSITINGFTKGSISGLQVGSLIFLDQLDDTSVPATGVFVCQANNCSGGGSGNGRNWRPSTQEEPQIVTSISGSGPWTIGVSPGVRMPNISASRAPQMWSNSGLPIQNDGIENMSLDGRSSHSFSNIFCLDCYNVWAKGLRFIGPSLNSGGTYQFWAYQSKNVTFRDSYGFGSASTSNNYMLSCWAGADVLYENNITQHMAGSYINEGCLGGVQAYTFSIDDYYTGTPAGSASDWQQASSYHHGSGDAYVLFEGNEGIGATADDVHGTSNLFTVFRNYYNGRDPTGGSSGGKTGQTNPILLYTYNRLWNIIGNVLGTSGYHTTYQCSYPSQTSCNNDVQIYSLGYTGDAPTPDAYTTTSMMRWGNYDTVNKANRFVSSEVPSGLTDGFANAVPASQSLPASFFKNAQPSWWGVTGQPAIPWPAIGPDVAGGNIANLGGHAYHIPAAICYLSVMNGPTNGSATLLSFDASTCYTASTGQAPAPPTNLNVVVQ
jgi:hypothetical protein